MFDIDRLSAELRTANALVNWASRALQRAGLHFGHGTANAEDEALQLVLHAAALDYGADASVLDKEIAPAARRRAIELIERRIVDRKPAPYLTGVAWFGGLRFRVDERVLIPRSSILELLQNELRPWLVREPKRILDLCTGSGCLAILAAKAFPGASVDATDISTPALAVAASNVAMHRLKRRVKLIESDLFAALEGRRYDVIISNPPYVGAAEMRELPQEYRHEPVLGLEADENGLAIVRRILDEAADHLERSGVLIVEVGNSEAAIVERWPNLPLTWAEFAHSEGGVFIIGAQQLRDWRASSTQAL